MMYTIFFVLYGLIALINISSIQYERQIIRIVSKMCLMPILILFYVFKSDDFSFIIISAMFFSWCGDILLIRPGKLRLYAGILNFIAAHILYVLGFIDLVPEINITALVVSFLFVLSIEYFLMKKLHIQNNYKFSVIIYGIVIGLLVVFSIQIFIWYKNIFGVLIFIGSILFFISDAVLAYFNTIKAMTKNSLMVIMLTYIIAQVCIIISYMNI